MKLAALIDEHHILSGLKARHAREAVLELLEDVGNFEPGVPVQIAHKALFPSGVQDKAVGGGMAVFGACFPCVEDFFILVGIPAEPLEDAGADGFPVRIIFLILASTPKQSLMRQAMAALEILRERPDVIDAMVSAGKRDKAWRELAQFGLRLDRLIEARELARDSCLRITPDQALRDVLDLMEQHGSTDAVVLSPVDAILGLVTSREIVDAAFPDYISRLHDVAFLHEFQPFQDFFSHVNEIRAGDVMNTNPLVVNGEDPLVQVVFRMKHENEPLALVLEQGKYAGAIERNAVVRRMRSV